MRPRRNPHAEAGEEVKTFSRVLKLFENSPELVRTLIASLFIGNIMLLAINLPLVKLSISQNDFSVFFTRPLTVGLLVLALAVLVLPVLLPKFLGSRRNADEVGAE